ncbi:hypothetical protein SAMCCGM7_pC0300 (plasmid) [Sinorhizobium americanum CCGM7]|nr:hypothetical protein [Sinorhizobium americanum]APG87503.1 hypothetical protein SAMCCGM7_pC0300 [Sinorhizobium americanum CCGM7]
MGVLARIGRLDLVMDGQLTARFEGQDHLDLVSDRKLLRQPVQLYRKSAWIKLDLSDWDVDGTDSGCRELGPFHHDAHELGALGHVSPDAGQPDGAAGILDIHEDQG